MDYKKIDSMLKVQANKLYAKGIAANSYHKIILPIIFIKFLTSKVEDQWKKFKKENSLIENEQDFKKYLTEAEFQDDWISIDYKYLWSNILKTSLDKIKLKLDGVFKSLTKYQKSYRDMSIFNFSSSKIKNSSLKVQIEFIENNYHLKNTSSIDLFGHIYEYFLETYNVKQGRGGEFYTPHSIVKLMVSITENRIENKKISIYDPTMGSGGMLTQSLDFLTNKNFDSSKIYFYGQEIQDDTRNMSRMNFLLRSQSWNFGKIAADTFTEDQFPNKKFDVILSNPPFNSDFTEDDYGDLQSDERFKKYGIIFGSSCANYNFFTHIISHLNNKGIAAVVMQPSAGQFPKESHIRRKYLEDNIIEAIINLPQNIFANSAIGANIWIFNKNKKHKNILFVDLDSKTQKINKLETIPNDVINDVTELFNKFENYDDKSIESNIPHKIMTINKILKDPIAKLSVKQNVEKIIEKNKLVSKKELANELQKVKKDLKKTFDDLEKTINYLIK